MIDYNKELQLNIEHQLSDEELKKYNSVGYEVEPHHYVAMIWFPNIFKLMRK